MNQRFLIGMNIVNGIFIFVLTAIFAGSGIGFFEYAIASMCSTLVTFFTQDLCLSWYKFKVKTEDGEIITFKARTLCLLDLFYSKILN